MSNSPSDSLPHLSRMWQCANLSCMFHGLHVLPGRLAKPKHIVGCLGNTFEIISKVAGFKALDSRVPTPAFCLMPTLLLITAVAPAPPVCEALITGQQLPIISGHTPEAQSPLSLFHSWGADSEDKRLARCGGAGIPTLGHLPAVPSRGAHSPLCLKYMGWDSALASSKTHFRLGGGRSRRVGLSLPSKAG